jgi:hypothetical protein
MKEPAIGQLRSPVCRKVRDRGEQLRFAIIGVGLFFSGVALVAARLGWF